MESWEAIAISQALRLGQFWHACNMPLTAHRHVNGKPLKIGINWRQFVPFHPLDLQKTVLIIPGDAGTSRRRRRRSAVLVRATKELTNESDLTAKRAGGDRCRRPCNGSR